jgi:hypothetical protein
MYILYTPQTSSGYCFHSHIQNVCMYEDSSENRISGHTELLSQVSEYVRALVSILMPRKIGAISEDNWNLVLLSRSRRRDFKRVPKQPFAGMDSFLHECRVQGCQSFLCTIYQKGGGNIKWPQNVPNGHKISLFAVKYTKWPYNIPSSSIKGPSKNYPKWDFVLKYTIWQPWNIY